MSGAEGSPRIAHNRNNGAMLLKTMINRVIGNPWAPDLLIFISYSCMYARYRHAAIKVMVDALPLMNN